MRINDVDVSTYKATQHTVTFGRSEFSNDSEWLPNAPMPMFLNTTIGFKELTVVLVVKDVDRESIIKDVSRIIGNCTGVVTLTLDEYTNSFVGILKKAPKHIEVVKRKWHKLELVFYCYERSRSLYSSTPSFPASITNNGTMPTPVKITITAKSTISNFRLSGISRNPVTGAEHDIVIPYILSGHTVIIDGQTGLVTDNGNPSTLTCYELPSLKVGSNRITCSHSTSYATVKFEYFYMYI